MAQENRAVVLKLVYFTVLMVAFPIGVFYCFHDYILSGEKRQNGRAHYANPKDSPQGAT